MTVVSHADLEIQLIYHLGPLWGISLYKKGIGVPNTPLLRQPFAELLYAAASRFKQLGFTLILLDGFRHFDYQSKQFGEMFQEVAKEQYTPNMPLEKILRVGHHTDNNVVSCPRLVNNAEFKKRVKELLAHTTPEFIELCRKMGISTNEGVKLVVTYTGNLVRTDALPLDYSRATAHTCGGAADLWLRKKNGKAAWFGCPYDYTGKVAQLAFFEQPNALELYRKEVRKDSQLKEYLRQLGRKKITRKMVEEFRQTRRIFYEVLAREFGCTFFPGETWHADFGGNPSNVIQKARLKNRKVNPKSLRAGWGSTHAHKDAAKIGYV